MKYVIAACWLFAGAALGDEVPTPNEWTCIARTPVLQRPYSGTGATEGEAKAAALAECRDHAIFGCYVASCDDGSSDE